ncbi:MAG: hypothetical protein IPH96_14835 [Saprospiraceae bacterium]|nr:hypothetical protein [Saprospiraceae bacterium]
MNNVNKKKSYSFLSDTEPTKEQLDDLMLAVLEDVKERAAKAEAKYKALQATALEQAQEMWQKKLKKNIQQ